MINPENDKQLENNDQFENNKQFSNLDETENINQRENTNQTDKLEDEDETAGYTGPADREGNDLDSGDTSSVTDMDKSAFSRKPSRTNKPLGSSHEPGTIPGRE